MARIIVNGTMIRLLWGGLNLWHLAWLVGFKKLGHDVYFVERSGWENDCYDIAKREMTNDCSYGIGVVSQLLSGYGLSNNWCFVDHYGNYHGLSKTAINEVFEYADLYLDLEWGEWMEESAKVTKRVFVDGEPGWFQLKLQRDVDNGKELPQYDYYSTVGGLIGTSHCDVPVGIWAWDSRNIIIQYNESFNNKTGATKDGGGFDLDGGMVNSIMQYNYSHDNDGPGYLLAQFSYAREHKENIVRYNISENDCRINRYGIIHIWGDIEDAFIYNNTIFHSGPDTSHAYAVAFRYNEDQRILDNFASKISLLNNIFYTSGKLPLVSNPKVDASFHFVNNSYFTTENALNLEWGNKIYTNIADWRKDTKQELYQSNESGFPVDPKLGYSTPEDSLKHSVKIVLYLKPGSPLIDKGINVQQVYNIKNVTQDINGVKFPQQSGFDLGACEFVKK